MPLDTFVILLGDNGTPQEVAPVPDHAKRTVFERGVRVPLILAGPGLRPGVDSRLAHVVDLFPTLVEGLRLGRPELDGQSLFGRPRDYVYVQTRAGGLWAVIEERWKLISDGGVEELYDLVNDPLEQHPLAAVGPDAERLRARRPR